MATGAAVTPPKLISHTIAHGPDDADEALEEMKQFARENGLTSETARMYKKAGVIILGIKHGRDY